jgi:hypothetical protein
LPARSGTVGRDGTVRIDGMGEDLGERQWVGTLVPRLQEALARVALPGGQLTVGDGVNLPYTSEIHGYSPDGRNEPRSSRYETDLLISDAASDGSWIPRIVIECKLGGVTTHDALSYSTKAATHKHVHPYLRYGFLAGKLPAIPARLVKHGAYFDFMATWPSASPDAAAWEVFISMLGEEVRASRALQALLTNSRTVDLKRYHLLRRQLVLS